MAKLHELVAMCTARPIPVVLLDTCALLDLIRIAGRENPGDITPSPEIAAAARKLLALAQGNVPQIHLICYELVPREWYDNYQEVGKGPKSALRRVRDLLSRFNDTASSLGLPEQVYRPGHLAELDGELIIIVLTDLGRKILGSTHQIERVDACERSAVQRSIGNVSPASKGKPELKDCLIIEHYLELCRQLPPTITRLFISSNTNDYGKNFNLFAPLDREFETAGLEWVKDFTHAQSVLEANGTR